MFLIAILIFANILCGSTASANVETQQLSHDRSNLQHPNSNDTQTPETEMNIAFDIPDLITTVHFKIGSVQLEGFRSVNNDKIMETGNNTSQLFWVSIGHPHFVKTKNPKNASEYLFFHSTFRGFTTYMQMMTEEQRAALVSAARCKYEINIDDRQVLNMILSKFTCSMAMYDKAGTRYLIGGNVSDFTQLPLRMDFDAPPGKIERFLFSELIKEYEDDLRFDCHIESSGGKLVKSNTLSIRYEQSQQIGIEEKLLGTAGKNAPNEVYVSRSQMFHLGHEMYSTLNILEEYEIPETQFNEAFVNDFISQLASSQFTQTSVDTVLASISKYSFDISADLRPDVIKKDFGSFLKVEQIGQKSRIILDEKKYKEVEKKLGGSGSGGGGMPGLLTVSAKAASAMSNREVTAEQTLSDQMIELNTFSKNEAQWEIEGEKIVPKSLNVARLMRSNMKKTLTFKRIRIQQFAAPFEINSKIYTSRSSQLLCQNGPTPKVCPYGFDYMPDIDQCLYLNLELMTWDSARTACARMKKGTQMIQIKDSAKQEAVRRYLQHQFTIKQESQVCALAWPPGGKTSWLGGQVQNPNECGTPYFWKPVGAAATPFNYTNWCPGLPNCIWGQQNCAFITSSPEYNYQWEDYECDRLLCSVCEF